MKITISRTFQWVTPFALTVLVLCPLRAESQWQSDPRDTVVYVEGNQPDGAWRLSQEPSLVIGPGSGSSSTEFWNVIGVSRLIDGTWAIGDHGSKEIRLFTASGVFLRSLAGEGEGPGELTSLWQLYADGGEIVAVDGRGVAHRFGVDGSFVDRQPLRRVGGWLRPSIVGYLGGRGLVVTVGTGQDPRGNARTVWRQVVTVAESGAVDTVGEFPAYERLDVPPGRSPYPVFGPEMRVATAGTRICIGYSSRYEFSCLGNDGTKSITVQRPEVEEKPVQEDDKEVYITGLWEANRGSPSGPTREAVAGRVTFSESLPAYGRFVGTEGGRLYVGPFVPEEEILGTEIFPSPTTPTVWSVYSVDGRWLTDLSMPSGFRLMSAGDGWVAGVMRDEYDAERVVVYGILRS